MHILVARKKKCALNLLRPPTPSSTRWKTKYWQNNQGIGVGGLVREKKLWRIAPYQAASCVFKERWKWTALGKCSGEERIFLITVLPCEVSKISVLNFVQDMRAASLHSFFFCFLIQPSEYIFPRNLTPLQKKKKKRKKKLGELRIRKSKGILNGRSWPGKKYVWSFIKFFVPNTRSVKWHEKKPLTNLFGN